ncbi:MAG: PEGA domain-containing protein [Deltaproteobacteria bacterium]|nr:PEGA domain-containing protein [Deltaproteobacteria bacterium]
MAIRREACDLRKPVPFGKYFLLQRINVGGMAEVFRAKTIGVEGFQKIIAIKRILPNIAEDEEFTAMFIDEAKIAVQLSHANIAQIFDLGKIGDSYFIALEYVHGKDLRAIFDKMKEKGGRFSAQQAAFIAAKVAEALDYAHDKKDVDGRPLKIVHRDVSPQNVLISYEGEVKLVDFGIAKAASKASKTQAGILKGKFGYMSPEQVEGFTLDRRSDIFSLGIIMYELLTGERLFKGESDYSTLEKVRNVEMVPPSSLVPSIPTEMERIIIKALAKRTENRYQTAGELLADLNRFLYSYKKAFSRDDLALFMQRYFANDFRRESEKVRIELQREFPDAKQRATKATRKVELKNGKKPVGPIKPVGSSPGGAKDLASRTIEEVPKARKKSGISGKKRPVSKRKLRSAPEDGDPTVVHDTITGEDSRRVVQRSPSRAYYQMPHYEDTFKPGDFRSKMKWPLIGLFGVAVLFLLILVLFKGEGQDEKAALTPLVVMCEPADSHVFINKRLAGDLTPLRTDLAPGTYEVEIRREGYEKFKRKVDIVEGKPAVVEAKLKKLPKGDCKLSLLSRPRGASLYLDGVKLDGKTPYHMSGITSGEHRLRAALEGYSEEVRTVVLVPGQSKRIQFILKPLTASLHLSSRPNGARILLNGKAVGKVTPAVLDNLPLHTRFKVTLRKPGFKEWWRYIKFEGLDVKSFNPRLEPIPEEEASKEQLYPKKRKSRHGRRHKVKQKPAILNINVISKDGAWAYVYVDGQKYGHTPKLGIQLSPGPHTIRLQDPKSPNKARVFRVTLMPGKSMTLVKDLK